MRLLIVAVALVALVTGVFLLLRKGGEEGGLERGRNAALELPDAQAPPVPAIAASEASDEPREAVAPAEAAAGPEISIPVDGLVLTGRVIDDRRRPVPGARATLHIAGRAPVGATADEQGHFRIEGVERPVRERLTGAVLCTSDDGRAGATFVGLWMERDFPDDEQEVGDIALGPGRSANVLVTKAGRPAAGASVLLAVGFEKLLVGTAETDGEGRARFACVPMGSLRADASLAGDCGRATAPAEAPPGDALRIELAPGRTLEVRVVEKASSAPLEGASVVVEERVMPPRTFFRSGDSHTPDTRPVPVEVRPTDASGRTRIEGLPRDVELTVSASKPGYGDDRWARPVSKRAKPDEREVTLELELRKHRSVRIPVAAGEVPTPAEGTRVALRPQPGMYILPPESFPETGLVQGAEILVEAAPAGSFGALATAPDGAIASLWCADEAEVGREASFRRPRTIVVHVEDAAGAPIVGARAIARNQGNNELCDWVPTDAEGNAVLGGLHGGLANVHVRAGEDDGWGLDAGAVDLEAGDGSVRAVIRARIDVQLALTIDGEPRLPARLIVHGAVIAEEDPERGSVRIEVPPPADGTPAQCTIIARDFLPEQLELALSDLERGAPIPVALRRAGALQVEVVRAPQVKVRLSSQRWDDEAQDWTARSFPELAFPNAEDGLFVLDQLEPGRYRVKDGESGMATEAVEVDPSLGITRVRLDLSATVEVSGRVVVPTGFDLALARVRVEGADAGKEVESWDREPGVPTNAVRVRGADGTFKLQVPADRPISLSAWHPILRAAREGGSVTITGASGEVVLALEAGPLCSFAVPEGAGEGRTRAVRVMLFGGEVEGEPAGEYQALIEGGRARFGGFAPGKYTLWIDPLNEFQPLVLTGVELGESDTDLGAPAFTHGSSIRFLIAVPEGQSAPRISAWAWSTGTPQYHRGLNSDGEADVVLRGLGPGTFKLNYGPIMARDAQHERELTLDGEHDEILELGP